ncbi:hypothetical protein M2298_000987 [Brevibacillus sp. 1238]|jgi:hypothetical protein|nr:hypothetical protein [Brevibacillus sp. 1238]
MGTFLLVYPFFRLCFFMGKNADYLPLGGATHVQSEKNATV